MFINFFTFSFLTFRSNILFFHYFFTYNHTYSNSQPQSSDSHDFLLASSSKSNSFPPPRRSTRAKAPSSWLLDYICPTATNSKSMTQSVSTSPPIALHNLCTTHNPNSTPCPLFLPTNLAYLSSNYVTSLVNVLQIHEPSCYAHANCTHSG